MNKATEEQWSIVRAYNRHRLGTFNFHAQDFVREPRMRRGHLPKMSKTDWDQYVVWCAGFERMMQCSP